MSCDLFVCPQWDGAVRMWEHRQTHPLEEEREREDRQKDKMAEEEKSLETGQDWP